MGRLVTAAQQTRTIPSAAPCADLRGPSRARRARWRASLRGVVAACLLGGAGACAPCQALTPWRPVPSLTEGICAADPTLPECYALEPRCLPDDPGCGPQPTPHSSSRACYRPDRARKALHPVTQLTEPGSSRSACQHDGECMIVGCGNACERYEYLAVSTNCLEPFELGRDDVLCGCVAGHCSFFHQ